ncbi:MAG: TetR/AcrR family transcriptional regulator [Alphaproteobacteria bacterium]
MNNSAANGKRRGRPRSFDREAGLDSAIQVFWAKGYEATSIDDLTQRMGIKPPSLYAAFGNKHDLFMQSLDRYAETIGHTPTNAFLDETDLRRAIKALFDKTIQCATMPRKPRGCLLVSVATQMAETDPEVQAWMSRAYAARVSLVAERVAAEQKTGRISKTPDAASFAKMVVSITHGLVARARVGSSRKEISDLAENYVDLLVPPSV